MRKIYMKPKHLFQNQGIWLGGCYNNFKFQDGPVPCQGNSYHCCFCLKILTPIVHCFFKIRLGILIALLYCPPPRNKIPGLPCSNPQASPFKIPRPPLLDPQTSPVQIPRPPLLDPQTSPVQIPRPPQFKSQEFKSQDIPC